MDTNEIGLQDLLDSVGINKAILAKLLDVSRKTTQRMGDKITPEVLAVIAKYKADMTHEQSEAVPVPVSVKSEPIEQTDKPVNQGEYDVTKVNQVTHRNIAFSCQAHGSGGVDKLVIAKSFNLSVFAYNAEVQNTINHCVKAGISFKELRA